MGITPALDSVAYYLCGGDIIAYNKILDMEFMQVMEFYYVERVKKLNTNLIELEKAKRLNGQ